MGRSKKYELPMVRGLPFPGFATLKVHNRYRVGLRVTVRANFKRNPLAVADLGNGTPRNGGPRKW